MSSFNLEAYFQRIHFDGPRERSVSALRALHQQHVLNIPFENIDVLLGRGIALDLPTLQRKLVQQKRGGYCFEQNLIFAAALRELGFEPRPILARVHWNREPGVQSPRTHLIHSVTVDDVEWLTDVGFGSVGMLHPMRLNEENREEVGIPPRRLKNHKGTIVHQLKVNDTWSDLYSFTDAEVTQPDMVVANWYTSTHPESHFRHELIVAIAREDARLTLHNNELTTRYLDGTVDQQTLPDHAAVQAALRDKFGIELPLGTRLPLP